MDESDTHSYFRFTRSMQNPQLFGDNHEHSLQLWLNQWKRDLERKQIYVWQTYLDGLGLDMPSYYIGYPYEINLNWK
jgi:hypothetical protein